MSLLDKLREKAKEHAVALVFVLALLLLGVIWAAVPTEVWNRISAATPKRALWATIGLLALALLLESAYLLELRRKYRLKPRFGVYWDRSLTPYCPACSKMVAYVRHSLTWGFQCVQCDGFVPLNDDNGQGIEIADARALLSGKQIEEPELDDIDMCILTLFVEPESVVTLGQVAAALSGKAQHAKHRLSGLTKRRYIYPSTVWDSADAPYHLTDKGRALLISRNVI
jgi:hypothetical protein